MDGGGTIRLHFHLSTRVCMLGSISNRQREGMLFLSKLSNQKMWTETPHLKRERGKIQQSWILCDQRGFGANATKKSEKGGTMQNSKEGKNLKRQSNGGSQKNQLGRQGEASSLGQDQAPNLSLDLSRSDEGETINTFEQRLDAIRRSAQEKKKVGEVNKFGSINYDAPPISIDDSGSSGNLLVKVGGGLAVLVFGLVFAFGDVFPSGNFNNQKSMIFNEEEKLRPEEEARLHAQLQVAEETIKLHPEDISALKGAAIAYAELGQYSKATDYARKLLEKRPKDLDALQVVGKTQNAVGDFEESALAYRKAMELSQVSPKKSFAILQGLVEALVATGKPNEAVDEILTAKEHYHLDKQVITKNTTEDGAEPEELDTFDPVLVELLLGRTYYKWGHLGDAITVYDTLIASFPQDFRGYLAKAILVKGQGQKGEAERMFIQARYLAPNELKSLVDQYSRT